MKDKLKHFFINIFFAFILSFINMYLAIIFCIIISLGKEFLDRINGNKISTSDLIADALGMLLGLGFYKLMT